MGRLIDADALKKDWGMADKCEDCQRDARNCQYGMVLTRMDVCGMLDDAPTVMGWVSVEDRLPEKKGDYIAYTKDGIVWSYFFDDGWVDSLGYDTDTVTHWMPLPEPPEPSDTTN